MDIDIFVEVKKLVKIGLFRILTSTELAYATKKSTTKWEFFQMFAAFSESLNFKYSTEISKKLPFSNPFSWPPSGDYVIYG